MKPTAKGIKLNAITLKDSFWTPYQQKVTEVVLPYQEQILNDAVPGQEKSHALANFRIAAGMEDGEYYGMVFQDSDVAKWLEAVAYSLSVSPDSELEARADEVISIVEKAQQPDGYLDTYFTIKEPEHRWQDMLEGHELYCMGHMMEAAAAYYEVTGKDTILKVAERMTDHISSVFGPDKRYGIPGHEEVETGLMRLYQVTGEEKYRALASYFIDARGIRPDFFIEESKHRDFTVWGMDPAKTDYNQSNVPVRELKEAAGHAVRAVYLYRGMTDVAAAAGDESLYTACKALWRDILDKKMYVTGAIGASGELEAFSVDYDLPSDRAYAETCAQVGMVFWAKSMLDIEPKGEYADVMERCLYNSTISGMSQDGKHFFYVNPLEVNPGLSGKVFGMRHVVPDRPGWYTCACCPPNLARMILSLGKYCWSENADTIYSHLLIGQEAHLTLADVAVESEYPWEGKVSYRISPKTQEAFTLAIHIPGYIKEGELTVKYNGVPETISVKSGGFKFGDLKSGDLKSGDLKSGDLKSGDLKSGDLESGESTADCSTALGTAEIRDGYLYLKKIWSEGDTVELTFPMNIRRVYASTRVLAAAGQTALMRGPIVYCLEGADNGDQLQALILPRDAEITAVRETEGLLAGCVTLTASGLREADTVPLYSENPPETTPVILKAIPYYMWDNRGLNQMRVWIRER